MNFIFRQPMDFSIILVGRTCTQKICIKRQHKTCENDFFVPLSSLSVCYEQIHI